jgi:hypothetical protein
MNVMQDDLSRAQLLDILDAVGGSGADLQDADDVTLAAIVRNRIAIVSDAARIEAALAMPLDIEWRGRLVGRRVELEQIAKIAPRKEPPYPGLTVRVPSILDGMTHLFDGDGIGREVREVAGHRVLDMTVAAFRAFLGGPHGKNWEEANAGTDVFQRLAPGLHVN